MSGLTGILIVAAVVIVFCFAVRLIIPSAVPEAELAHEDETDEP